MITGFLSAITLAILAIIVVVGAMFYSIRLQRRAVMTQNAVVDDHFSEKAQRERHLALAEEVVEIQKRAAARDDEAIELLRRSVQLNEEILQVLRKSHG